MPLLLTVGLALLLGLWTSGLARSKGRNGSWLWGGTALVLTLVPLLLQVQDTWRLLGMGPLFVLLFMRSPRTRVDAPPKGLSCPRCNAAQLPSQRYCVDCGWELGRAYPETLTAERAEEAARASAEELGGEPAAPADSAGVAAEAPAAETFTEPETHFVPEVHAVPEADAGPDVATEPEVAAPVAASQEVQSSDLPGEANEPEVETEPEPPVFRGLPTPANMTERGIRLFNLGRIQESIDQYTKAIALDPNYKEAWEYRAEAYARLGRGEQAAEDRRRLQALNTG